MQIAPLPNNEAARLELLHALDWLDTPPEPALDAITRLAARLLGVPMALISLIDEHRQFFKANCGLDGVSETPRDIAFCAHAILSHEPLVVPDARMDARFRENPAVTGAPHVRFYAGIPITSTQGLVMGTLCVVDSQPRELAPEQLAALIDLATLASEELRRRELQSRAQRQVQRSRELIEDSEARFRSVFEQAAVGIALLAPDGSWLQVNQALCELLGYSAEELLRLTFQDVTCPEDLQADLELTHQLIRGEIAHFSMEKRYVRRDGDTVWANLNATVRRNSDGTPQYFISVVESIQSRKNAEASLQQLHVELEARVDARTQELSQALQSLNASREQLKAITDNIPALVAYVDAELRYRFVNDGYRRKLGVDPQSLLGCQVREAVGEHLYSQVEPWMHRALAGERVTFEIDTEYGGLPRHMLVTYVPDRVGERVLGFHSLAQDITERRNLELLREREARQDALTGLPNRRALFEQLALALQDVREQRCEKALVFIDLDGFKAVNDSHGHEAGDALLCEVAQRLRATVPPGAIAARLAGDEFIVLLERSEGAEYVVEKLRQAIAAPLKLAGHSLQVSASAGIARFGPDTASDADELMRTADAAMYEAKRLQRLRFREGRLVA